MLIVPRRCLVIVSPVVAAEGIKRNARGNVYNFECKKDLVLKL